MKHAYILIAALTLAAPALAERSPECAPADKGCSSVSLKGGIAQAGKASNSPNDPDTPDHPGNSGPKGNNGWGNGDQNAPGNSGPHNNAENNHNGKPDPSHGGNGHQPKKK